MKVRAIWHQAVLRHGLDMQSDGEGYLHLVCDCGKYVGRVPESADPRRSDSQ